MFWHYLTLTCFFHHYLLELQLNLLISFKVVIILHKISLAVICVLLISSLVICGTWTNTKATPTVEITEVRSDYGNVLYEYGQSYHGFIELYNPTNQPLNLTGWYLSDSTLNINKYQIPECVIEPYSYKIFWSNTQEDVVGILTSEYFLGFSLSENESILLSSPDGTIISKTKIPELVPGHSYSKGLSNEWGDCIATPGIQNVVPLKFKSDYTPQPTFSLPSGFYENTIEVEIIAKKGLTVYYTLDGSKPTTNSLRYEEPLVLTDATPQKNRYSIQKNISTLGDVYTPEYNIPKINVIRAIAVDKNGICSNDICASYFIDFNNRYGFENTYMLSIITDPNNLFSDELGIYVLGQRFADSQDFVRSEFWQYNIPTNYNSSGKGWRRPVKLELFNQEQKLVSSQMGSISIHGNWSVAFNQKSFNVYSADDDTEIFPGIFDSQSSSVMLRAGGYRDLYSTKFRDILNQNLVSDRNITVQDSVPCQVFINGEYWGFYNLQERINEGVISSTYNENKKNLVILKNGIAVSGNPEDSYLYKDILDYVSTNDLSIEENYNQVCEWIDIQSYIDYYCFQIYVANCDSVANNYALWRTKNVVDNKYGDGKWRWILYDTDDSLSMVPERTDPDTDSFITGHWSCSPLNDQLFSSLMRNPGFKEQFKATFYEMAQNNFSFPISNKKLLQLQDIYMPASVVSHQRFIDQNYSESDYRSEVETVQNFLENRSQYICYYMENHLG